MPPYPPIARLRPATSVDGGDSGREDDKAADGIKPIALTVPVPSARECSRRAASEVDTIEGERANIPSTPSSLLQTAVLRGVEAPDCAREATATVVIVAILPAAAASTSCALSSPVWISFIGLFDGVLQHK